MSNYTAKNNIDELTNKIKKIRNQIVKQLDSHPDFIRVIIININKSLTFFDLLKISFAYQ